MRTPAPTLLTVLLLGALVAGCGSSGEPTAGSPATPAAPATPTTAAPAAPARTLGPLEGPDFRLHLASGDVDLKAWTACYGNGCYDGAPRAPYVDAGRTDAVEFSFAHPGWTFDVTFREPSGRCPRHVTTDAVRLSPTRFRIDPAGNPGTWDVEVFGRGPQGDAVTTFRWRTEKTGRFPSAATGSLAVLADHDGRLDSYGVELGVADLASTPRSARATVTVTATDGQQVELDLGRAEQSECYAAGAVAWNLPDKAGREAARLPGTSFDYRVDLELDGTTYVGRAAWPADTNEDIAPGVPLTWTPALPVYRG